MKFARLLLTLCLIAVCTAVVASELSNAPATAIAPGGRIVVCQQGGALRVIKSGALLPTPFLNVTGDSSGERGDHSAIALITSARRLGR